MMLLINWNKKNLAYNNFKNNQLSNTTLIYLHLHADPYFIKWVLNMAELNLYIK